MDHQRFRQAIDIVQRPAASVPGGIGTLGEKTLHSILKHYVEPDISCHEIRVSGYVADIMTETGIIEIQTRQFNKLRKKLPCFLQDHQVTVVYPVAETKYLVWLDGTTGEVSKKRKSPKTGKPWDVFFELYKIKELLTHPNLTLHIVLLELVEYRFLDGWNDTGKKGSTRHDRVPTQITGEVRVTSPEEYALLIPAPLGQHFTSKDFKKASGLTLKAAQTALNVLYAVGAVQRTGKSGNAHIYERTGANQPGISQEYL